MPRRRAVALTLPEPLAAEIDRRAARCGCTLTRWIIEALDAHVAEERCRHGAAAAEVPPPRHPAPSEPAA